MLLLKKGREGGRRMVLQTNILDWAATQAMIRATNPQEELVALSAKVIGKMGRISQLQNLPVEELHDIPLGRLRRDAVRLHAVCRYNKGVDKRADGLSPSDVRRVDVHPDSINEQWRRYAAFLLYHEYLHALGFVGHDRTFRALERLWPDEEGRTMGKSFGDHLRRRSANWLWTCPQCGGEHARTKRSNGRYRCRTCRVTLLDVSTEPQG